MDRVKELIERYPQLEPLKANIIAAIDAVIDCYKNGGKVMICGNGGSASDSSHIVGELMKGFVKKRPIIGVERAEMKASSPDITDEFLNNLQGSLPAINFTENSAILSAFANDVDPDMVYAQLALGYTKPHDVLIGITTSGNSKNVINACLVAKAKGAFILGLTGRNGGKLKSVSDVAIVVPETETFKIQELHLPIYHCICAAVEEAFYTE